MLSLTLAVVATAGLLVVPMPRSALAGPVDDRKGVQQQIAVAQDDLEGTSRDLITAYSNLAASTEQLPVAQRRLATAQADLLLAKRRSTQAKTRVVLAVLRRKVIAADVNRSNKAVEDTQMRVARLARSMYEGQSLADLSVALGVSNVGTLVDTLALYQSVSQDQNDSLSALQVQLAESRAMTLRARAVEREVTAAERAASREMSKRADAQREAVRAQMSLTGIIDAQRGALSLVKARRSAELARLTDLRKQKTRLDALIRDLARKARAKAERQRQARIRAIRDRAQAERAARRRSAARSIRRPQVDVAVAGRLGSGALLRPVDGPVTSPYGWRIHPIYNVLRMHTGTDFGSGCGTAVLAPEDGVVVRAGSAGGYGNQLVIDHGAVDGVAIATSYNHLQGFAVVSGFVRRGQVIAYVGNTGASTGCHLHWEVFVDGTNVDPMDWV